MSFCENLNRCMIRWQKTTPCRLNQVNISQVSTQKFVTGVHFLRKRKIAILSSGHLSLGSPFAIPCWLPKKQPGPEKTYFESMGMGFFGDIGRYFNVLIALFYCAVVHSIKGGLDPSAYSARISRLNTLCRLSQKSCSWKKNLFDRCYVEQRNLTLGQIRHIKSHP